VNRMTPRVAFVLFAASALLVPFTLAAQTVAATPEAKDSRHSTAGHACFRVAEAVQRTPGYGFPLAGGFKEA